MADVIMSPTVAVRDLRPGDRIVGPMNIRATHIINTPHPLYEGLALVVWWLPSDRRYSFDALSYLQVVGEREPDDEEKRKGNLVNALKGKR